MANATELSRKLIPCSRCDGRPHLKLKFPDPLTGHMICVYSCEQCNALIWFNETEETLLE